MGSPSQFSHCKLLHAQQLLGYSENEVNTTITDLKDTDCF